MKAEAKISLTFLEPEDVSLGCGLILLRMPASDIIRASDGCAASGQAGGFSLLTCVDVSPALGKR